MISRLKIHTRTQPNEVMRPEKNGEDDFRWFLLNLMLTLRELSLEEDSIHTIRHHLRHLQYLPGQQAEVYGLEHSRGSGGRMATL